MTGAERNTSGTRRITRRLAWRGGESLHSNHQAYPRAPKFSVQRVEFDRSWLVIRALGGGLVVVVGPPVSLSTDGRAIP